MFVRPIATRSGKKTRTEILNSSVAFISVIHVFSIGERSIADDCHAVFCQASCRTKRIVNFSCPSFSSRLCCLIHVLGRAFNNLSRRVFLFLREKGCRTQDQADSDKAYCRDCNKNYKSLIFSIHFCHQLVQMSF